jgi:hypothetical protein
MTGRTFPRCTTNGGQSIPRLRPAPDIDCENSASFQNQVVLESAGSAPPVLENQSLVYTAGSRFLEEAVDMSQSRGTPGIRANGGQVPCSPSEEAARAADAVACIGASVSALERRTAAACHHRGERREQYIDEHQQPTSSHNSLFCNDFNPNRLNSHRPRPPQTQPASFRIERD